jgi:hypothetical protein
MPLKSVFKSPGEGVIAGLAEAIAVYLIYQSALPPMADVRAGAQPNDTDIEAARKSAAVKSSGIVGLVFLLTRDLNAFIVGGASVAGIDYMYKHHNAINPIGGHLDVSGPGNVSSIHSLPDYSSSEAM